MNIPDDARFELHDGGDALCVSGAWTLSHYRALLSQIADLRGRIKPGAKIDFSALTALDTAGAHLLCELVGAERLKGALADATLTPEQRMLLETVAVTLAASIEPPHKGYQFGDLLVHIGEAVSAFWGNIVGLLGFIGLTLEKLAHTVWRPRRWHVTATIAQLERIGFDAVPIVALLTFLVGAVVAFLGATVLEEFGATIYTVDLVAYSFLREFGVFLAAILVAGRTSSAFAAQIGSMRANEEIDAIRVLGIDPVEWLVLPRVLAMVLALPILTFIAIICGIAGGMTVCALNLEISPGVFLSMFASDIGPQHFFVGIGKAPVFAFLIASIGCLEGFRVSGSAQSVGEHTTSAVVQSIFTVIVVDAIAALFCMEMGW
ncbi:MAG: MlaE family lipid ABC transporter permease subunit [Betaproteobacteria bacterium]|nr:MlaE family lipid ABC transporter permease subunit [Betaproteobacteria bacterium]